MTAQLVVFDLAGTTVHDNRDVHRALQLAMAEHQVEISLDDANNVMGIPKPVAIEKLLLTRHMGRRPITEDWILQIHEEFVGRMSEFYANDSSVRETAGVSATFAALIESGIQVAVNTGFDRTTTRPLLDRLGWSERGLINWSITSDEVARGRPFPDMINKVMMLSGVTDPARVAKVGDTPADLQEGFAAGCGWVIGVTTGAFSRESLSRERSTHLIEHIPQVLALVNG